MPPDGSDRLVVITQDGDVLIFPNDPSAAAASEMLSLRRKVIQERSNEEGLLGLAFHPRFRENLEFLRTIRIRITAASCRGSRCRP